MALDIYSILVYLYINIMNGDKYLMKDTKLPLTKDGRSFLKMKDVRSATSLPASTIQYYQKSGLLHDTVKTSPNMAYYHPDTIDRIKLIRLMKDRYHLPMAQIAKIISENQNDDAWVVANLNEVLFGPDDQDRISTEDYCDETGLSKNELKTLIDMELLLPLSNDFDLEDVKVGKIFKKVFSYKLPVEDIKFYRESAIELADKEMEIRNRLSRNKTIDENSDVTKELTDMARLFRSYIFDRTFQQRILSGVTLVEKKETK